MAENINIAGRLHSTATGNVVAGANEILDDELQKKQSVVNAENESFKDAQSEFNSEVREALGTGGTVDERIANAVNTEKDRAEGTEEALDGRIGTLEDTVGTGGSVDSRISTAVATETTRAQAAEADRYTKSETYTKEEVHNLITTPSQEYVSVTATDQTTAVTDVLPATGVADTIYRVGNWDGTQYNDSVFTEYAWNGSAYIELSTKSQIGEVYDISENHADTKYSDLAAALGVDGANIPQSLRKGGMSVKFVQSSDNKYVQYRLMSATFNTTPTNWQGVDDEPTAGSENLVKSGGIASFVKTNVKNFNNGDFAISDELGYAILKLLNGEIETKNFKSNETPKIIDADNDLSFSDIAGYTIVVFKNGHIKTSNFDSASVINKLNTIEEGAEVNNIQILNSNSGDLSFSDDLGYVVLRLKNGNIETKNFNSYAFQHGPKTSRIDFLASNQIETKVLTIKEQEMVPSKGSHIITYNGKLYFVRDGVKSEIALNPINDD